LFVSSCCCDGFEFDLASSVEDCLAAFEVDRLGALDECQARIHSSFGNPSGIELIEATDRVSSTQRVLRARPNTCVCRLSTSSTQPRRGALLHLLAQQNCNRIDLFSRRAARHPHPDHVSRPLAFEKPSFRILRSFSSSNRDQFSPHRAVTRQISRAPVCARLEFGF
jgi:hypothetical protein